VARIECLSDVGLFVKDLKKARQFYTRKIGLKVRSSMPKYGYIALGTTLRGEDASLNPWAPEPSWGQELYEKGMKEIGTVTGIGFRTGSLDKTVAAFKKAGVSIEVSKDPTGDPYGRFQDLDGNTSFVFQPRRPKVRRGGLLRFDFVTVVARDLERTHEFFTKGLGLRGKRTSEGFAEYRVSPKGTAVTPFTPNREMYEDPADYDADMAHMGESTSIGFEVSDIYALQEKLMARGVRFSKKATKETWGGIQAKFLDPDDNEYSLVQME
jgi:catechol 2,3-dioxygenase-like lactoylglutathione lyase family enzyme